MSFADEFDERGREARVDEAALSRVLQAEDLYEERLRRCEAWAQHSARQLNLLQTHYDALTARYQASVETLQAALETLHQRVAALGGGQHAHQLSRTDWPFAIDKGRTQRCLKGTACGASPTRAWGVWQGDDVLIGDMLCQCCDTADPGRRAWGPGCHNALGGPLLLRHLSNPFPGSAQAYTGTTRVQRRCVPAPPPAPSDTAGAACGQLWLGVRGCWGDARVAFRVRPTREAGTPGVGASCRRPHACMTAARRRSGVSSAQSSSPSNTRRRMVGSG